MNQQLLSLSLSLSLAVLACSGGDFEGPTDSSTGDGVDGAVASKDGGTPDVDHVKGDATSGDKDSAVTADAPSPFANDYFPLGVGLTWEYQATKTDGTPGTSCGNSGIHTATFSSTETDNGVTVYLQSLSPGCYFKTTKYRRIGDMVDVYNGAWYHFLDLPPVLNKTWAAGGASGASFGWVEHLGSYTVAAGTFNDCWKRKQSGYDVWEIYCRGVGMVLSHYAAWGGDQRHELISTNVK